VRRLRKSLFIGCGALLIVDALDVCLPLIIKIAIDVIAGDSTVLTPWGCAFVYVAVISTQGVMRIIYRYNLSTVNVRTGDDLRISYCRRLMGAPAEVVERERTGDLVSRLSSDVDTLSGVFDQGIITFFDAMIYLIAIPIIMCCLSWKLAVVALLPLPLIPWIVTKNESKIRERYRESQENSSGLSAFSQEAILGSRILKSFGAEKLVSERYRHLGESYVNSMLRLARTEAIFSPSIEIVVAASMLLLFFIGGQWAISGAITVGTFIALQRYTQQLLYPMQALGATVGIYQRAVASSERTAAVLSTPQEESGEIVAARAGNEPVVQFRNVSFGYPGASRELLKGISFEIRAGERVAIVGPNGAGKSSLVALIPKLYAASSGEISVFGEIVSRWDLRELRAKIGFVTQDVFIFSGTVNQNVAFDSEHVPEAVRIQEACTVASLDSEIKKFPGEYDCVIGERGITLSGGQRQRLSIARAAMKRAPLLILDDVFSSVDSQTELSIRQKLLELVPGQTQIIISHRLSSVRDVDRILVLQDGRITQQGSHAQLISVTGWYRRFYEEQSMLEEIERYARGLHERK
jgi:ATP-binding cassette subfamily B protein